MFSDSTSSLDGINFYFGGSETIPASGTYTIISWLTSDTVSPVGNQVMISSGGFNGYYSTDVTGGTITVTNVLDVITIVFTNVKVSGFTGSEATISGNLVF